MPALSETSGFLGGQPEGSVVIRNVNRGDIRKVEVRRYILGTNPKSYVSFDTWEVSCHAITGYGGYSPTQGVRSFHLPFTQEIEVPVTSEADPTRLYIVVDTNPVTSHVFPASVADGAFDNLQDMLIGYYLVRFSDGNSEYRDSVKILVPVFPGTARIGA